MLELVASIALFALLLLAFWLIADSDDDNNGGGLPEPAFIPIPIKENQN